MAANIDMHMQISHLGLNTDNFHSWEINMKALLRRHKLWDCVSIPVKHPPSALWREQVVEAADLMTPFIRDDIKDNLEATDFDNSYMLLRKLEELCVVERSYKYIKPDDLFQRTKLEYLNDVSDV